MYITIETPRIVIGIVIKILEYDTPTLFPHCLQVAGMAGPKHNLRHIEIAGLPQCGHLYILITSFSY